MLFRQLASGCKPCRLSSLSNLGNPGSLHGLFWPWRRSRVAALASFREVSTLPNSRFFRALNQHDPKSWAIVHGKSGLSFNYGNLVADVLHAKELLLARQPVLSGQRIAFVAENSYDYVGMFCSPSYLLKG